MYLCEYICEYIKYSFVLNSIMLHLKNININFKGYVISKSISHSHRIKFIAILKLT
jgi:hypothetical protein